MDHSAPSVADLREVQARLAKARDGADLRVSLALAAVLRGADPRTALGLKGAPGQRSPLSVQREHDRNHLLRRLASKHFGHLAPTLQARAISEAYGRYLSAAWRFDRFTVTAPANYAGDPREILFEIAMIGDPVPGPRRLIDILSECNEQGVFAAS